MKPAKSSPKLGICSDCGFVSFGDFSDDARRGVAHAANFLANGLGVGALGLAIAPNRNGPRCPKCDHINSIIPGDSPVARQLCERLFGADATIWDGLATQTELVLKVAAEQRVLEVYPDRVETHETIPFIGRQDTASTLLKIAEIGDLTFSPPSLFSPYASVGLTQHGEELGAMSKFLNTAPHVRVPQNRSAELAAALALIDGLKHASQRKLRQVSALATINVLGTHSTALSSGPSLAAPDSDKAGKALRVSRELFPPDADIRVGKSVTVEQSGRPEAKATVEAVDQDFVLLRLDDGPALPVGAGVPALAESPRPAAPHSPNAAPATPPAAHAAQPQPSTKEALQGCGCIVLIIIAIAAAVHQCSGKPDSQASPPTTATPAANADSAKSPNSGQAASQSEPAVPTAGPGQQVVVKMDESGAIRYELAPAPETPSIKTIGSRARLLAGKLKAVPICVDQASMDEYIKFAVARDDIGIEELFGQGRVFNVANGAEVLIIEATFASRRIRVLDGDKRGSSGWVPMEWVK